MRDRREVLKLLAGGTAVAAGASLVTTSTAFAFGGTASCRPNGESGALPTVSLGTTTAVRVGTGNTVSGIEFRINNQTSLTPAAATCSTCHPGVTPTASIQYRWSLDNQGGAAGTYGFFDAANGGSEVTAFRAAPIPGSIFLRRTDAGGPAFPSTANTNLDYTVRLTIRWVCQNVFGGRTRSAWRCRSFTMVGRFARGNGAGDIAVSLQSGPTESTEGPVCDAGISA